MSKKAKSSESENDNYDDMKPKKGHKQEGSGNKSSEVDLEDQREAQEDGDQGDPFEQMMRNASRNSRYTVAFIPNQGTADPGDPSNISPDEHENMPKKRRKD